MLQAGINPIACLFLLIAIVVILRSSRQVAVGCFLVSAAIIPLGQQILVPPLHLYFLRILILVVIIRIFIDKEKPKFTLNKIDRLVIYMYAIQTVCGTLRGPNLELFGNAFNALGSYFGIRILSSSFNDIKVHLKYMAVIAIIVGSVMTVERVTHRNPFFVLGGVPEFSEIRDGKIRCQGPFRHPILAGTFGATLFPMLVGLWMVERRYRIILYFAIPASILIAFNATSSGAVLTLLSAVAGFALWPMRYRMKLFRWIVVIFLTILGFNMKVPIWWIIAKISDLVGGGGWHRSYLIDVAINHFSQWWLIGTSYTANWAPSGLVLLVDPNNMDITNQYIVEGVAGGIWEFCLFLALIAGCFKIVGQLIHQRELAKISPKLSWTLGIALAGHCTAFISISYFDQIIVFWFWLLAVISSTSESLKTSENSVIIPESNEFALARGELR